MKIIENNSPYPPEWPKLVRCDNCGSKLEIVLEDLIREARGGSFYDLVFCPCCGRTYTFGIIKNPYLDPNSTGNPPSPQP